jgi:hypothetical protein
MLIDMNRKSHLHPIEDANYLNVVGVMFKYLVQLLSAMTNRKAIVVGIVGLVLIGASLGGVLGPLDISETPSLFDNSPESSKYRAYSATDTPLSLISVDYDDGTTLAEAEFHVVHGKPFGTPHEEDKWRFIIGCSSEGERTETLSVSGSFDEIPDTPSWFSVPFESEELGESEAGEWSCEYSLVTTYGGDGEQTSIIYWYYSDEADDDPSEPNEGSLRQFGLLPGADEEVEEEEEEETEDDNTDDTNKTKNGDGDDDDITGFGLSVAFLVLILGVALLFVAFYMTLPKQRGRRKIF